MSSALSFAATDRVLVFSPHPDDESIAAGGLLQAALAAGAAVRVIVVTNGDNNPWPQRWFEKRWRIDAAGRARWGARRRREAENALRVLGVAAADAQFPGLPDLGLTGLLLRADAGLVARLRDLCARFAPTHMVLPALSDRHPDHSALHVLLRLALAPDATVPRLLSFSVHGERARAAALALALTPDQVARKRAAIRCHLSQMRFSSTRFLAFAANEEAFDACPPLPVADPGHPLRGWRAADALHIRVDRRRWRWSLRGQVLLCAFECGERGSLRWQLALDRRGDAVDVHDCVTGAVVACALRTVGADSIDIAIPCARTGALDQAYIKLARPQPGLFVFDRFGWQVLTLEEPQ